MCFEQPVPVSYEGDSPAEERFGMYFRVPRDRYLQAWAAVLATFNPIEPV